MPHIITELGLVDSRYVEPGHRREVYRLADGPEQHYLTCLRCGVRVLIATDLLNDMARELVRRKGVSVTSACACCFGCVLPITKNQKPTTNNRFSARGTLRRKRCATRREF